MRRALVLGLGRFGGGREAARFLGRRGVPLRIADRASAASLGDPFGDLASVDDVEWRLGDESPAVLDDVDLVVVNPAIPDTHPVLVDAARRGVAVTQEVNLFLDHYPGKVVLVTGTNGKSTTTTLCGNALRRAGVDSLVGGNIGHSLLADESRWRREQVAVVEISSFQLERIDTRRHRAAVAVLTRITSDHLDRHGTLAAYHAAKARAAAIATDCLVHDADDPVAASFASPARSRVRYHRRPPADGEVGRDADGWVVSRLADDPGRVVHEDALELLGGFHVDNAMAAFAGAAVCGAARHDAARALATTGPLPYRLQLVAEAAGRRIYDNSVSTEVESTLSALVSVRGPIHWVGGGKSKDGDFARVARTVAPHIRSAHLFGAAAEPMLRELLGVVPATRHDRIEAALDSAWAHAAPGDAVLFSPAFASFDQYPNFRARGDAFRAWAAARRRVAVTG